MALLVERHPAAEVVGPFEDLALLPDAMEQVGTTMAGLSYREIFEYGKLVTGGRTNAAELDEAALQACLADRVHTTLIGIGRPGEYSPYEAEMTYSLENKLDRAIAGSVSKSSSAPKVAACRG